MFLKKSIIVLFMSFLTTSFETSWLKLKFEMDVNKKVPCIEVQTLGLLENWFNK